MQTAAFAERTLSAAGLQLRLVLVLVLVLVATILCFDAVQGGWRGERFAPIVPARAASVREVTRRIGKLSGNCEPRDRRLKGPSRPDPRPRKPSGRAPETRDPVTDGLRRSASTPFPGACVHCAGPLRSGEAMRSGNFPDSSTIRP